MTRLARMSADARSWYLGRLKYLAEKSPNAARDFQQMIKDARMNLAEHPKIGPAGFIQGTRRLVVRKQYVLTVGFSDGVVEIATMRHARQNDTNAPNIQFHDDDYDIDPDAQDEVEEMVDESIPVPKGP